jgi:hypothetical protein
LILLSAEAASARLLLHAAERRTWNLGGVVPDEVRQAQE